MAEAAAYTWTLVPGRTRELYDAAMAIDRAAPASIDTTWQTEGTVQIPIALIVRLREALR